MCMFLNRQVTRYKGNLIHNNIIIYGSNTNSVCTSISISVEIVLISWHLHRCSLVVDLKWKSIFSDD